MIDTNVFRYRAYFIGDLSSAKEKARQQHKLNAKSFWDRAIGEVANKETIIMASNETKQELKVHSHTLKKESKAYNNLLKQVLIETFELPQELEYMLRDFSNYVRGKHAGSLVPKPGKTNYLQTADTRIFIHAYLNDAVLVTANVKDFFLYSLFFDATEDNMLYDLSSGQYIKLLPTTRKLLESDAEFINLNAIMKKLKV